MPMRAEFSGFSFSRMFLGRGLCLQPFALIVDQALIVVNTYCAGIPFSLLYNAVLV